MTNLFLVQSSAGIRYSRVLKTIFGACLTLVVSFGAVPSFAGASDFSKSKKVKLAVASPPPAEPLKDECILLQGAIQQDAYPLLEKRFTDLLATAEQRQADSDLLKKKGKQYNAILSKTWAGTLDIAELLTEYKGFEQSSEAGDIILNEKLKIKSKGSADYAAQLRRDRTEQALLSAVMQLAEGVGDSDATDSAHLIEQGSKQIDEVAGKGQSEATLQTVKEWCAAAHVAPNVFESKPLSIIDSEQQTKLVLDATMKSDPVVEEIRNDVHKHYNGRSNFARVSAKVLNFSLSIAGYSPTVISPVTQIAWTLYIATQGGPEESKLLKEVYLGQRFDSRFRALTARSSLAVNSHNKAILTKNAALLAVSEWMIERPFDEHKLPSAEHVVQLSDAATDDTE